MITIRDLSTLRDYADCVTLQDETWGAGFSERVPTAILRVSQMIGGVAAGAFDETGRMAGFVFGMTGLRDRELVHWSDMLAVREGLRGQGIGERLKQYQRDQVLALGVKSMLWTFDPIQALNAHFNINHLGALPIEYVKDMYGNTGSTLHGTMPTDRFIVRWQLDPPSVPPGANTAADVVRVEIPADFADVRREGADASMRWRLAIRETMTDLLARGYRVVAFEKPAEGSPCYLLSQRA